MPYAAAGHSRFELHIESQGHSLLVPGPRHMKEAVFSSVSRLGFLDFEDTLTNGEPIDGHVFICPDRRILQWTRCVQEAKEEEEKAGSATAGR